MTLDYMPVDDGLCAVEGCPERGRPQVCPYDGRYHHHGKVHYENDHPAHPKTRFRTGAWRGLCDPHYAIIDEAVRSRRAVSHG